MNPDESLVHRCTINKSKSIHVLCFRFANLYSVQKVCFMDWFRPTVFKRFVSWIRFVLLCSKDLFREIFFQNYSICIDLEGFLQPYQEVWIKKRWRNIVVVFCSTSTVTSCFTPASVPLSVRSATKPSPERTSANTSKYLFICLLT